MSGPCTCSAITSVSLGLVGRLRLNVSDAPSMSLRRFAHDEQQRTPRPAGSSRRCCRAGSRRRRRRRRAPGRRAALACRPSYIAGSPSNVMGQTDSFWTFSIRGLCIVSQTLDCGAVEGVELERDQLLGKTESAGTPRAAAAAPCRSNSVSSMESFQVAKAIHEGTGNQRRRRARFPSGAGAASACRSSSSRARAPRLRRCWRQ